MILKVSGIWGTETCNLQISKKHCHQTFCLQRWMLETIGHFLFKFFIISNEKFLFWLKWASIVKI